MCEGELGVLRDESLCGFFFLRLHLDVYPLNTMKAFVSKIIFLVNIVPNPGDGTCMMLFMLQDAEYQNIKPFCTSAEPKVARVARAGRIGAD